MKKNAETGSEWKPPTSATTGTQRIQMGAARIVPSSMASFAKEAALTPETLVLLS